jgi:hypothetical protein
MMLTSNHISSDMIDIICIRIRIRIRPKNMKTNMISVISVRIRSVFIPSPIPIGGNGLENDMPSLNRDSIKTDIFHKHTFIIRRTFDIFFIYFRKKGEIYVDISIAKVIFP